MSANADIATRGHGSTIAQALGVLRSVLHRTTGPDRAFRVRRGFAAQLNWTIADRERAAEQIAEQYDCDLYAACGTIDTDGRAALIALASSSSAAAGERPLAWIVAQARPGSWVGAYRFDERRWWTVVVGAGRLMPGPANDKIHEDRNAAQAALRTELAEANAAGDAISEIHGTPDLQIDGYATIAEELDDAIRLGTRARRARTRGIASIATPKLRRTKAAEYLKRQLLVVGAVVLLAGAAWWAWVEFVDVDRVQRVVAPPPPPPPPPPWLGPNPRVAPAAWARACENLRAAAIREIAGWALVSSECTEDRVRVRWRRRPGGAPFSTIDSFERQYGHVDPRSGLGLSFEQQGDDALAALPMFTPAGRQAAARIDPAFTAPAIQRRMWQTSQVLGARIDLKPPAQLPMPPNSKIAYSAIAFAADIPQGRTLGAWVAAYDIPGMSIEKATWTARTALWSVAGVIFERK